MGVDVIKIRLFLVLCLDRRILKSFPLLKESLLVAIFADELMLQFTQLKKRLTINKLI